MSTRFFEHQADARRQTFWLVFLFGCAVLAIIAMLYALAVVLAHGAGLVLEPPGRSAPPSLEPWQPGLLLRVVGVTLFVVSLATVYKIAFLRGGGAVVAQSLGGRLVPTDTGDRALRTLLNVVEEMSIASGVPTPPVYLMAGEAGINAFAAGFDPNDAVIGVSRGAVERLSRDELQGVIAHEFSHILNGDMRLNIRLMGAVFGILVIGYAGYWLLRSGRYGRGREGALVMAAGMGLAVIGFAGTFFGNLIKAAVSRQREFLADASAVQFTRNPLGIADALKKIGGWEKGSRLDAPSAVEASHIFFGNALTGGLQSLFSTHPPLAERIRRLDPSFDPDLTGRAEATAGAGTSTPSAAASFAGAARARRLSEVPAMTSLPAEPAGGAIDQVGEPTAAHLDYARDLIAGLPAPVRDACREPYGARAVVFVLLLDRDEAVRRRQLDHLARTGEGGIAEETLRLYAVSEGLDVRARLPLIDLSLPALQQLSPAQFREFYDDVRVLVDADEHVELFEWMLRRVLFVHLRRHLEQGRPRPRGDVRLVRMRDACSVLLSVLSRSGSNDDQALRAAFEAGAGWLPGVEPTLLPADLAQLADLDVALDDLAYASLASVERVLHACAAVIAADGAVTQAEGELFRGIADALDVPMPPLLPGQPLI